MSVESKLQNRLIRQRLDQAPPIESPPVHHFPMKISILKKLFNFLYKV